MPFAPDFCNVKDRPWFAGGGDKAKMPASRGLGVELESNFFTHSVPTLKSHPHPLLSLGPQLLPISTSTPQLYKNIACEVLKHLKRPYDNTAIIQRFMLHW